MMYLVQDGSHVDVVCKTLADVEFEMYQRYDYFRFGLCDVYFIPEQKNIKKGFHFFSFEESETGEIELYNQYFCTFSKIESLEGLSKEVLNMSEIYFN